MGKTAAQPADSARRALPAVERILSSDAFARLAETFGRARVKEAVVRHLDELRARRAAWDDDAALEFARRSLLAATRSPLRRVINGSGILIHTNLGRSPIDADLWSRAGGVATA